VFLAIRALGESFKILFLFSAMGIMAFAGYFLYFLFFYINGYILSIRWVATTMQAAIWLYHVCYCCLLDCPCIWFKESCFILTSDPQWITTRHECYLRLKRYKVRGIKVIIVILLATIYIAFLFNYMWHAFASNIYISIIAVSFITSRLGVLRVNDYNYPHNCCTLNELKGLSYDNSDILLLLSATWIRFLIGSLPTLLMSIWP